ncbi:MAG: PspC domain-containing protein, partial [Sphaerochaetaceae bacterium]|nr:PspC domain-containing protein [Sphaerochaetaceae bacterium]
MKKLYRSRNGKVFGVCQGFADWRELPVDIIRLIVIVAILTTGFFPGVVIYALLAL